LVFCEGFAADEARLDMGVPKTCFVPYPVAGEAMEASVCVSGSNKRWLC